MNTLEDAIIATPARSAWARGVKAYALDLIEDIQTGEAVTEKMLLNGARDWRQYSEGGCPLVYDSAIAERLCSPSEYKRTREGQRAPNARETWIDVQARALYQAAQLVLRAARNASNAQA